MKCEIGNQTRARLKKLEIRRTFFHAVPVRDKEWEKLLHRCDRQPDESS